MKALNLVTILLFVFITNPVIKLTCAITYIFIYLISGLRVKILPNIILFITITFINILYPYGEILFNIGPFKIAKDSIVSGIERSSLLIGLLYLSKNISLSSVKLPGKLGIIVRDTFFYFNQLTRGERVKFKTFNKDIDNKLLNLDHNYENIANNKSYTGKNKLFMLPFITILAFILDLILLNF